MSLSADKSYILQPYSRHEAVLKTGPKRGGSRLPALVHVRLRQETIQAAEQAGSLSIDLDNFHGAALLLDKTRHELAHSEEAPFTSIYVSTRDHDSSLHHVGAVKDRFSERPADISAVGQRLKERREEEAARRAEHRTVLLDAPAHIKGIPTFPSTLPRSSSLSSLNRTSRQGSEAPSGLSGRGSPSLNRAQSRPNLISAESIRRDSPTPSATTSNALPNKEALAGPSSAAASTYAGLQLVNASPYSSPRFSLRTRLVQFLAMGPKPRRQIVAALAAPETQVLALLSKVADRPAELQPDVSTASSPALGGGQALPGSPQMGGSARFAGPVNRRVTGAAVPARPHGHLSPSTVYLLKDSVYLDEVNIDSWTAYSVPERRMVSKHAHEAFKRMGVTSENDPDGWSKLYPDGWPTEAELRRESEREELDRDPNFAMVEGEVLSEIDSDELERDYGIPHQRSATSGHARHHSGASSRGKRRRDHGSGSERGSYESSSDLSDVPDTLPPLSDAAQKSKGHTPPPLSSHSSSSSLGLSHGALGTVKGLSAPSSTTTLNSSSSAGEKPPPKKRGPSTLERIARAARGKGPSAAEREKQIQRARQRAAAAEASSAKRAAEKSDKSSQREGGKTVSKAKGSTSTASNRERSGSHSQQQSLPSMDFSKLHEIGRLRQQGVSGAGSQDLRRTNSLNHLSSKERATSSVSPPKSSHLSNGISSSSQREHSRSNVKEEPADASPRVGATKKFKKKPQRRDIEFTDSSDDEGGKVLRSKGALPQSTSAKRNAALSRSAHGSSKERDSPAPRWQTHRPEDEHVESSGDERMTSRSKSVGASLRHSTKDRDRSSREGSMSSRLHDSRSTVRRTGDDTLDTASVRLRSDTIPTSLPGSMTRPHRSVGTGMSSSAEPWLELRSVGDWHRLAERFLRVYGTYRADRDTIERERQRLLKEMEAAERETEFNARQEELEKRRQEGAAAAAAAAEATASQNSKGPSENAANAAKEEMSEDSLEEGEMTSDHDDAKMPPSAHAAVASNSTGPGHDADNATSERAAISGQASGNSPGDPTLSEDGVGVSWRADRSAADMDLDNDSPERGRSRPWFARSTQNGLAGRPGTSSTRLGTSGPMPLAELESLVTRCKARQGELYRMKKALVLFKKRIESQEGRASESEGEVEGGDEGGEQVAAPAPAVMGLGLDTSAGRGVDRDGDVSMA
ncbi:hypothetical protein OC846_004843 [Tilletia horrida]|uniref:Uncharacterized protein n=1 Tax=Tilletia horrida TaxID=155126 RepID=A0AAN6GRN0_9BASI|nr:hypothetical protein OC846_004843 [Tilletia horrida]